MPFLLMIAIWVVQMRPGVVDPRTSVIGQAIRQHCRTPIQSPLCRPLRMNLYNKLTRWREVYRGAAIRRCILLCLGERIYVEYRSDE